MAPRPVWPPQGSLRAYVDLSIAHWRVASYLRGSPDDEAEPEPEPPTEPEPVGSVGEPDRR